MKTRDIVLFAMVLFLGLKDLGLAMAPADGLPLYDPDFVLFAHLLLRMQPVYRIPGHGTRELYMTDYVVSFNLVNCSSKTHFSHLSCPLSTSILVYPSIPLSYYPTISTLTTM